MRAAAKKPHATWHKQAHHGCKSAHKQLGLLVSCGLPFWKKKIPPRTWFHVISSIRDKKVLQRPGRLVQDSSWWQIPWCATPPALITHVVCKPQRLQEEVVQCEQSSDLTASEVMKCGQGIRTAVTDSRVHMNCYNNNSLLTFCLPCSSSLLWTPDYYNWYATL